MQELETLYIRGLYLAKVRVTKIYEHITIYMCDIFIYIYIYPFFIFLGKDEYKEPYSCLRTFSFEKDSDTKCRSNCEKYIDKCKHNSSIGECLIQHSPNYKCVYCGM